jgi:MinD-like ATPase involved in chromosome partitioning or flagellar assembly
MRRYVDVRPLTGHTSSRLDLVASDADPGVSRPFGSADYRRAADILTRFYSLVLTDCGAGLMHDTMGSVLDSADQVVLVMTPAVDGARSADLTLDWLDAHGYSDLVRGCVAVVNSVERRPVVDLPDLLEHFGQRCRAVLQVPRDPHLAEGAATDLDALTPPARRAYLTLAAAVADGFEDASVRRARTSS